MASVVPQIAEAWGTTRAYVYKLAKKGCPIESIDAATTWRNEHSKIGGVGYRSKGMPEAERANSATQAARNPVCKDFGHKGDDEDEEIEKYSPQDRVWAKKGKVRVKTIEQSLKEAILVEEMAAVAVRRVAEEPEKMVTAINAYNKAQSNRMEAEKRVMLLDVERKQLVPIDTVRELIQRAWGPMLARLRSAARRCALKANPHDDALAEMVFREEIEEAIAEGQASYAEAME